MRLLRNRLAIMLVLVGAAGCTAAAPGGSRPTNSQASFGRLGDVLLRDSFDNIAEALLPRSGDAYADQGYLDGEYFIRLEPSAPTSRFVGRGPYVNTHAQVDLRLAGGLETRWVGLYCRMVVSQGIDPTVTGAYVFAIQPAAGWFGLGRLDPSSGMVRLVSEQFSPAVRRGSASNHVELTCAGRKIVGRVNGTELASAEDGTLSAGNVGLYVSRHPGIPVEARYDNLVIHEVLDGP